MKKDRCFRTGADHDYQHRRRRQPGLSCPIGAGGAVR